MRNPFCDGMTQTSPGKHVDALRSATSAAQLIGGNANYDRPTAPPGKHLV